MKKLFSYLSIVLFVVCLFGAPAMACRDCQEAHADANVATPPVDATQYSHNPNLEDMASQFGWTGHSYNLDAYGAKSADVNANGRSTVNNSGYASQQEVCGGESSKAFSRVTGYTMVRGQATGVDYSYCWGCDYASVDLEVSGFLSQGNGAYSDDLQSWIDGGNNSSVDFSGQTDKSSSGCCSKTAHASDFISANAQTEGCTDLFAKNTPNSAFITGKTSNFGSVSFCGAEHTQKTIKGSGGLVGYANLPAVGYAGFDTSFEYKTHSGYGAGQSYGTASVVKTSGSGCSSVTSSVSAGSSVGGYSGCNGCQ